MMISQEFDNNLLLLLFSVKTKLMRAEIFRFKLYVKVNFRLIHLKTHIEFRMQSQPLVMRHDISNYFFVVLMPRNQIK